VCGAIIRRRPRPSKPHKPQNRPAPRGPPPTFPIECDRPFGACQANRPANRVLGWLNVDLAVYYPRLRLHRNAEQSCGRWRLAVKVPAGAGECGWETRRHTVWGKVSGPRRRCCRAIRFLPTVTATSRANRRHRAAFVFHPALDGDWAQRGNLLGGRLWQAAVVSAILTGETICMVASTEPGAGIRLVAGTIPGRSFRRRSRELVEVLTLAGS